MTEALFPMAELATRWGVTPNTVSRRLAFLRIKPVRQGNFRFLTAEEVDLGDALQEHIIKGKPMEAFVVPGDDERESFPIVRRQKEQKELQQAMAADQTALVAALVAKLQPPADPLLQARRLKEAADLGVWLSNAELASVLGMAESTLRDKSHDYSPRPGFQLEKRQEKPGSPVWWRVREEGAALRALPTSPATRPVGFAGVIEHAAVEARCQTISSTIELPFFS